MRPLIVVGNVNVDLIMGPTAPWPRAGTEVIVESDDLRPGGSAGNTALAWSALGVPFTIASNVGDDVFGRWLSAAYQPHSRNWVVSPTSTTISVGLTHPDNERTFFTTKGHLPELSLSDVLGQIRPSRGGIALLSAGFLMDRLAADYPAFFDWADANDIEIALDPGWPVAGWTDTVLARARSWVGRTHHLLINEIEARELSGSDDPEQVLWRLAEQMPRGASVVVKSGPKGAIGLHNGKQAIASAPSVTVKDTIGAGDIFNAGYLLARAEGADLAAALQSGTSLASHAISTTPRSYQRAARPEGVI